MEPAVPVIFLYEKKNFAYKAEQSKNILSTLAIEASYLIGYVEIEEFVRRHRVF